MKRTTFAVGVSVLFAIAGCDGGGRTLTRSGSVPCIPGSGMVETWCAEDGYCEFRVVGGGTYSCDVHDGTSCQDATMEAVTECQNGGSSADGSVSDGGIRPDTPPVTNPCESLCTGCPSSTECYSCYDLDERYPTACNGLLASWGACVRGSACDATGCSSQLAAYTACTCTSVADDLQEEAVLCGSSLTFDCSDPSTAMNIRTCGSLFSSIGCAAFGRAECGANPCAGTGLTACGSSCVNTATDVRNCGVCGRSCRSDQTCNAGACTAAPVCNVTGSGYTPPLPAACMPRCSAATESAVYACADAECTFAALAADTTPGIDSNFGIFINCDLCARWQLNSCYEDSCPTQFAAYSECARTGAACTSQNMAVQTCITANRPAVDACVNSRLVQCFP